MTPGPADVYCLTVGGPPVALHHLVLGCEPIPEWMSIVGGARDRYLLEPVTAAAVEYADGHWILLDAGFNAWLLVGHFPNG